MITIYHNVDFRTAARMADPGERERYHPAPQDLELAAVVACEDLDAAFDRVIHRDGDHWSENDDVMVIGDRSTRRSSQEGDVFVAGDGTAHLVLPRGFRLLPGLRLPFLPGNVTASVVD